MIGVEGKKAGAGVVIMGLREIICVKLLTIVKPYRIERIFHSVFFKCALKFFHGEKLILKALR